MSPIVFKPIYQQRVWGGRSLETHYKRTLPHDALPYGESWEVSDRAGEQSVVSGGVYDGLSLNELWRSNRSEIFGKGLPESERFPLLIKILDAQQDVSLQVHPTLPVAQKYGGDPKTEMWYIADADVDAKLYVGIKEGVTEKIFKDAVQDGTLENHIHSFTPSVGDSILIESGRLHAIGAGLQIFEIQENSDTTYRVFDWNRKGLDGNPRQLHVEQSMACIDFDDIEPQMDIPVGDNLCGCDFFKVDKRGVSSGEKVIQKDVNRFAIISVISGVMKSEQGHEFKQGDFFILPVGASPLEAYGEVEYLETSIPV